MKKVITFVALVCLLLLVPGATPVFANGIPALPHAFYGNVTINGSPAPVGTSVEARGEGVATGVAGNPTTTTAHGVYGTSNPLESRLIVQGDIDEGTTITFYVNDVSTGQTAEWHSGETTQLPLSVTVSAPPPGGGNGTPPSTTVTASIFGSSVSFSISSTGEVLETVTVTSPDGKTTITIPKGTKALDKNGKPLTSLTADVDTDPPNPPEGDNIIGIVYDFGPEGATFDPPIDITFDYDPEEVPEESELVIMEWDEDAGEWVELDPDDYSVNTETNTVTVSVDGFSKYAIIARAVPEVTPPTAPAVFSLSNLTVQPGEIETGETVNIAVTVANTGGTAGSYTVVLKLNDVKEAEKSVTVAAGASEIVTFPVSGKDAGSYSVTVDGLSASFTVVAPVPPPPPEKEEEEEAVTVPEVEPTNWALIGGIIAAAVVVVGLLVFFLVIRRRTA